MPGIVPQVADYHFIAPDTVEDHEGISSEGQHPHVVLDGMTDPGELADPGDNSPSAFVTFGIKRKTVIRGLRLNASGS